jgi:DNA-binding MarR family transcriptional regulator
MTFTANPVPCNHNCCICIYIAMRRSPLPSLPCMCANFRRTSRALTQLYENALRPLGLRATQLTILQALSRAGEVSQGQLGEMLAMDTTSLTRTLAIMSRQGWIAGRRGKDKRERRLRLSSTGERKLRCAMPVWERTQSQLRGQLGEQAWNSLLQVTHRVTEIVTTQGGSL